jgi:hypothetical protein
VYQQKVLVRLCDGSGKIVREELDEYLVTPTPDGIKKERTAFHEYARKGKLGEIDEELAHELRDDLTDDRKAKDGLDQNLFPLTSKEQRGYDFQLAGSEVYRGLPAYRITFAPKKKSDERAWKGEVLVNRDEYQPVLIRPSSPAKSRFWSEPPWERICMGSVFPCAIRNSMRAFSSPSAMGPSSAFAPCFSTIAA